MTVALIRMHAIIMYLIYVYERYLFSLSRCRSYISILIISDNITLAIAHIRRKPCVYDNFLPFDVGVFVFVNVHLYQIFTSVLNCELRINYKIDLISMHRFFLNSASLYTRIFRCWLLITQDFFLFASFFLCPRLKRLICVYFCLDYMYYAIIMQRW